MGIHRIILDEHKRLRDVVKCAILHGKGYINKEISNELGISPPTVTRYIQRAKEDGIIKIEVHPPLASEVDEKIQEMYGLREAYVFPIGIAEEITNMLGGLSAAYLDRCLDDEKEEIHCVAVGPGRTILAFVRALADKKRPEMIVGSTTSATGIETHVASNVLIGIPAGKWKCGLRRFDPEMTPAEQRNHADVFFFGIGEILDMKGVTAAALLSEASEYDFSKLELQGELVELAKDGGTGFINYQPLDKDGEPMDWDIEIYNEVLKPTVLKLEVIREIAENEKKKVVCIAGGEDKVDAIRAGLIGGYFNVLITDYETAAALVEQKNE